MWRISPRMPTSWGYSPLKTSWKIIPETLKTNSKFAPEKSMVGRWNLSFWGNFGLFLGAFSLAFRECFFLNLSTYATHTIPYHHWVLPHSAVDTICICDHEPGKNQIIVDLVVVSTNPIETYAHMSKWVHHFSPIFRGWTFLQKYEWNHHLMELFFPIESTNHTWNVKDCFWQRVLFMSIVMYSWLLCTPFATLKKYMNKWNLDPLKKKSKMKKLKRLVSVIKLVLSIIQFLECCNKQSFNREHVLSTPHPVPVTTRITTF